MCKNRNFPEVLQVLSHQLLLSLLSHLQVPSNQWDLPGQLPLPVLLHLPDRSNQWGQLVQLYLPDQSVLPGQ
jgi:hypothetical protein